MSKVDIDRPVLTTLEVAALLRKRPDTAVRWLRAHGATPLPDLGRNKRWSRNAVIAAIDRAASIESAS